MTFTATVGSSFGTPPDGETVTFATGLGQIGIGILSGGVATVSTSALPSGSHTVRATYSGDGTFAASIGRVAQVVEKN